jgi:hypothetical protein
VLDAPSVAAVRLVAHPDNPAGLRQSVAATLTHGADGSLAVTYEIRGAIDELRLPTCEHPAPNEALWSTTCCELFVAAADGNGYREFNFSPSGQWAVYAFTGYRERTDAQPNCPAPTIVFRREGDALHLDVGLLALALPACNAWRLGISAVLETRDGRFGYWALAHAPGKADFHHPAAFALSIERNNTA